MTLRAKSIVRARERGLSLIANVGDIIHPYLGGAAASSRRWLAHHRDMAERFIRGFHRATLWVRDPANRAAAIDLLVDADTTPELAAKVYDLNLAPDGLAEAARLDHTGLRQRALAPP
ncbi:MAG TPA: hypothetical protein VEL05_11380 [Candidatus Acidoferrum sp.]|nr:hypothetical protein [Candidatus Acidoferrum sp.]